MNYFFFSPAFFTFSPQIPLFLHKSRIFARPPLLFASLYVRNCPLHHVESQNDSRNEAVPVARARDAGPPGGPAGAGPTRISPAADKISKITHAGYLNRKKMSF
jgi:hypothetical protein